MPRAELPSTLIGWLVAVAGSLVGLLTGMLTLNVLGGIVG